MPLTLLDYVGLLPAFALVLARLAGLMIAAPMFSGQGIPRVMKMYLVVAMAFAVFPSVAPTVPHEVSLRAAAVGLFGELAFGLALGLGVNVMLLASHVTGMIIEHQAGLAIGQVIDPLTGSGSAALGQVYFMIAGLMFFGIGGDRELVRVLLESFSAVPVLGFSPGPSSLTWLVNVLSASFVLAVRLAAPVIAALLLTSVVMGFLTRTVPQLNVLSVGLSLKITVALVVLSATFPIASWAMESAFATVFATLRQAMGFAR